MLEPLSSLYLTHSVLKQLSFHSTAELGASSDDLHTVDDDIDSIIMSPVTIRPPEAQERITSLVSGPNGAVATRVRLFAFSGFSPISKEAYEDQKRRGFNTLKNDQEVMLVKLKKAEATHDAEVRRNGQLRQQKYRVKKRAQEIHNGTHLSQKKVCTLF